MKGVYIVVALLIVGGLWYMFGSSGDGQEVVEDAVTETEEVAEENGDEAMEEEENNDEDGAMEENDDESEQGEAMEEGDEAEVVFDLTGKNFEFSTTEMRVKVGDKVTVNFESVGGFHDWVVDAFDAATEKVSEGGTTSVTFVASEAGEYEYYCSVGNHRAQGMVGNLIVE